MSLHRQTPPSTPLHRLQITPPSTVSVIAKLLSALPSTAKVTQSKHVFFPSLFNSRLPASVKAYSCRHHRPHNLTTNNSHHACFSSIKTKFVGLETNCNSFGFGTPSPSSPHHHHNTTTTSIAPPRNPTATGSTSQLTSEFPAWEPILDFLEWEPTSTTTASSSAVAPPRTFLQTATPLYAPPPPVKLTPTDITSYFSMDRGVYSRLVSVLSREPHEAFAIMAVWVYLDRTVPDKFKVMPRIALLSNSQLNSLAEETAASLHCMKNEFFPFDPTLDTLPIMQEVSQAPMSLHLFHQHRVRVQEGLAAAVEEMCKLALDDILRQCFRPAGLALIRNSIEFSPHPHQKEVGESSRNNGGGTGEGSSSGGGSARVEGGQVAEVRPDDRTIFLTFSKGYPVAHEELVEFFMKVFGDVFEEIKMEEVGEEVQPLFAKMVMRDPLMIPTVLNGQERARFNIKGKHVFARQFIPRDNRNRGRRNRN